MLPAQIEPPSHRRRAERGRERHVDIGGRAPRCGHQGDDARGGESHAYPEQHIRPRSVVGLVVSDCVVVIDGRAIVGPIVVVEVPIRGCRRVPKLGRRGLPDCDRAGRPVGPSAERRSSRRQPTEEGHQPLPSAEDTARSEVAATPRPSSRCWRKTPTPAVAVRLRPGSRTSASRRAAPDTEPRPRPARRCRSR